MAAAGLDNDEIAARQRRYEQTATPFEWKFTRGDLTKLLERLADKPDDKAAACQGYVTELRSSALS